MWIQKEIIINPRSRGFHLITNEVVNQLQELNNVEIGLLNLFIKHTSASLTINENADATVRTDMEKHFNVVVPEGASYFDHTYEGPDDMPAHIKSTLIGASQSIPISNGALNMGIWQGLYLCEHREHGGHRTIVATIQGSSNA